MINFQQSDVAQDGPNVKAKGEGGCMCMCFFFLSGSQEIHKTGCHRLVFTACLNVYFWCVYSVSSLYRVM